MEQTVDTLEAMFQKANSDLNYLSRKIEFEFEQGNQENQGNPVKMLQKITDIKKEYANLVKEVAAIQDAQKEAVEFIKIQLVTLCELVQKAAEKSQEENGKKPEEMDKLEEILGIKLPQSLNESTSSGVTDNSEAGTSDIDDNTFTLD